MGDIVVNQPVKSATLSAVVIRADGTTEELGVIATYKAPLKERVTKTLKTITRTL